MSEEKKTVELKDEELEKVSGGTFTLPGSCGRSLPVNSTCSFFTVKSMDCLGCTFKPKNTNHGQGGQGSLKG